MIELIPAIDIIDGKCVRLSQGDYGSKKVYNENPVVDHMMRSGSIQIHHVQTLFRSGFTRDEFVYFVHSYYVPVSEFTAAETDYIRPFSAALHKDNFYATQFHPEKSGEAGERIIKNFLEL